MLIYLSLDGNVALEKLVFFGFLENNPRKINCTSTDVQKT